MFLALILLYVGSWPIFPLFDNLYTDPNHLDLSYTADFIASSTAVFAGGYSAIFALEKRPFFYQVCAFVLGIAIPITYSRVFHFQHYVSITITYLAVFSVMYTLVRIQGSKKQHKEQIEQNK